MQLTLSAEELKPLVAECVAEALAQLGAASGNATAGAIGLTEAEAAARLGVPQHVLRDCRRRGEIAARKVGRRFVYSADSLRKWITAKE